MTNKKTNKDTSKNTAIPQTLGQVFSEALEVYGKNLGLFLSLGMFTALPAIFNQIAISSDPVISDPNFFGNLFIGQQEVFPDGKALAVLSGTYLLGTLFTIALNVVILSSIFDYIKNRELQTLGEVFSKGVKKVGLVLLTSIAAGAIILLGIIALIIPGIIAAIAFMFVPYVQVEEPMSVKDALIRSKDLVLARPDLLILWFVMVFAIGIGLTIVNLPITTVLSTAPVAGVIITSTISGIAGIFFTIGYAMVYLAAKERLALRQSIEG